MLNARALIISVTVSVAPFSSQSWRKMGVEIPAIGAHTRRRSSPSSLPDLCEGDCISFGLAVNLVQKKMNKKIVVSTVILAALGALLYILLPDDEEENSRQPVLFNRPVKLVDAPAEFQAKGVGDSRGRHLDRLIWGTNPSIRRSIDLLVEMGQDTTIFEAARRINLFRRERPSLAKKYIDLLAEIKSPKALPTLLDCATDPAEIISKAAIRSLSAFEDPESTKILIEQTRGGSERLRLYCIESLAGRTDPDVFDLLRELAEDSDDLRIRIMAVEGIGNFDIDESRRFLLDCLQDSNLDIRTVALKSLLRLGVPEANGELEKMLSHEGPVRLINGVKLMEIARWLPPIETLQDLASHPVDNVRIYLTVSLLTHLERDEGEQFDRARSVLQYLLNDQRPDVRLKALEGLYKAGDKSTAGPYLRKLGSAVGAELAEAIEILTTLLDCAEAPALLIRRFREDQNLTPVDRRVLLSGLATAGTDEAIELFFEVIGGGWDSRTAFVGEFTLDRHAAFQVHSLGPGVLEHWEEYLESESGPSAAYLFVNGMRNLGDPRAADSLLAVARNADLPDWIRQEAIKSFAYLDAIDVSGTDRIGKRLLTFHRECADRTIAGLAYKVFWNFF